MDVFGEILVFWLKIVVVIALVFAFCIRDAQRKCENDLRNQK